MVETNERIQGAEAQRVQLLTALDSELHIQGWRWGYGFRWWRIERDVER